LLKRSQALRAAPAKSTSARSSLTASAATPLLHSTNNEDRTKDSPPTWRLGDLATILLSCALTSTKQSKISKALKKEKLHREFGGKILKLIVQNKRRLVAIIHRETGNAARHRSQSRPGIQSLIN
jgi:hypothetical protein